MRSHQSLAQINNTNSGPLSAAQLRLQETHRKVSAFNRAKLAQKQSSAQGLGRQRAGSDLQRAQQRGTPALSPGQGRFSVRTSVRPAAVRADSGDLARNDSADSAPRSVRSGATRDRAGSDELRLPNLTAGRMTRMTQITTSNQTIDVQPGQRVRIVIDGQSVYVDS